MITSSRKAVAKSIALNWQLETLLLALAGMEICWFTPLFLAFTRSAWVFPPYLVALMLWFLVWGMMRLALFLAQRQIGSPLYELIVIGMVVLSSLLVIRLYVYWGTPWHDWSWLPATGRSLTHLIQGISDEVIVLGTMLFLWWRAISLSQQDHSFQSVGYEFRRNVLLLIVSMLILSYLVGSEVDVFVAPFFFCCLLAVALARVKDKSQVSGGIERPFGPRWLAILIAASLLVLGLGWLLGHVYSVEGFGTLLAWMDPFFVWMGRAAGWLVVQFLRLLGPLMEWVINTLNRLLDDRLFQAPQSGSDELLRQMQEEVGEYGAPPAWVLFLGRYLCPTLIVVAALLLIVVWLERRRRWRRRVVEDERESLWEEAGTGLEPGGLLQQAWERLRELVGQVGRFGIGRRLYAAISVRYIYANVIRLAERRGVPRPPAKTPNEFLRLLVQAFPENEADLERLTEAYVKVHYGELLADHQELDELRACWERLRGAAAARRLDQEGHLRWMKPPGGVDAGGSD